MAYNLQPLITILEQILDPKQTRWIVDDNKAQLQSLLEKSVSLQQIFEETSLSNIECLESEIRDAAHKAEDMIESHMVDQMLSRPGDKSFTFITPDLQQVMQQLDSVKEQAMKFMDGKTMESGVPSSSSNTSSDDLSSKSVVVGVDEDLMKLKDRVMGLQSKLEIVPIVGMGGIGKTTLARKLYQDPSIVEHFTSLAWTTVSQDYDVKEILLSLLRCLIGKERVQYIKKKIDDKSIEKQIGELRDTLHRNLYGRRYMIVFDDIWSIKFWDEIRKHLPETNNGSRIVLTTRETEVAKHANSHSKPHEMQLLNESESWDLLRQEVFGDEEDCLAALEKIGRNIARNCGGLPLAICVIGGLLSKANKSKDVWKNAANDVTEAVESDKQFSNILSLSYNHLPTHLRPCFLYMGAFPEGYEIKASRLMRLWVAEGFLKKNGEKSLEEEAEDCLKALVDRNLVSVRAVKSNGRPKSYGMHDLMRDLCLKKAEKQKFAQVGMKQGGEVEAIRRVSIHSSLRDINILYASDSMSLARSFLNLCHIHNSILSRPVLLALRFLRVLDLLDIYSLSFPTEILQIVNLRYLAFTYGFYGPLPSAISRLYNLQTLVISSGMSGHCISLPCEILQLAELRHLMVHQATDFLKSRDWGGFVLDKLQTFVSINSSREFLHRIPNVKKLGIQDSSSLIDLYHLHKLEALRLSRGSFPALLSPSILRLPPSLKKLSLRKCIIVGGFMNYLCELPNLEVLKLKKCKFEGGETQEWDATQEKFCTLKFLLLEDVDLVKWEADETNFPRLRHLVILDCPALEEIPSGIGEIPTLQTIELDAYSSPSLVASAKLIIEEQRDNGNNDLQLRVVQGLESKIVRDSVAEEGRERRTRRNRRRGAGRAGQRALPPSGRCPNAPKRAEGSGQRHLGSSGRWPQRPLAHYVSIG